MTITALRADAECDVRDVKTTALRTGEEYLASLRKRQIRLIVAGEVVTDVTTHPGFRNTAQSVAAYFDLYHDPALRDVLTYEAEDGQRYPTSFLVARSKEDLRRRAAAYAVTSEATFGMMGRSPDYMNGAMAGLMGARGHLEGLAPKFALNVERLYTECRAEGRVLTHTFVNTFKGAGSNGLRIVRRDDDGVWLSGHRGVATLAPFAEGNMNLGDGKIPKDSTGLSFLQAVGRPGMSWVCRDRYDLERSRFDAPLSSRYEEMDCIAVFDECFVPWSDVFVYAEQEQARQLFAAVPMMSRFTHAPLQHHSMLRQLVKTRFILGLAHMAAEQAKLSQHLGVQVRIGEIVSIMRTLEALSIAAIETAEQDPLTGVFAPNPAFLATSHTFFSEAHPKMMHHLRELSGSRTMSAVDEATIDTFGALLEPYTKKDMSLFRMIGEISSSSWGVRQDIYEMFHAGSVEFERARLYTLHGSIDKSVALVLRALEADA